MEKVLKTPNKGKRKIPIEPITNKTRKQVTFSKRRGGLFKKGSELSSLCGADVAIITFSGAGKLFGFGHPSAESVIQRYVNSNKNNNIDCNAQSSDNRVNNNDNGRNGNANNDVGNKYSRQYKDVIGQIEAERRASTSSSNVINNNGNDFGKENDSGKYWWNENIDELGLVELEHFKVALEGLRNEVATRVDEISRSTMSLVVPQNIDFGNNNVAHCQESHGSTTKCWNDGMGRENFPRQVLLSVDSFLDMFPKPRA